MNQFKIKALDHVAIRVRDVEQSVSWYREVLRLEKLDSPEWNNVPVFMVAGKTGVAIFPARLTDPELDPTSKNIKIDHFAFNVSNEDFEKAKEHFKKIGQEFEFQNHFYFHSIYTKDPDGHVVELTTLVVEEDNFYK